MPKVVVDKDLIGGVRAIVGDKVLDGTVKARLAEMQSALTSLITELKSYATQSE